MSLRGLLFFILFVFGIFYGLASKPGGPAGGKAADSQAAEAEPASVEIVIYTQSSCEPCDRAKEWMTQRHIAFEERNVERSSAYEDDLKTYGSRIVPVILVNGEPQYGFQSAYFDQSLKDAKRRRRD